MRVLRFLLLVAAASVISYGLSAIGMILPWLFGSMIATILYIRIVKRELFFPRWLGDLGVIIMAIEIGSTLTLDALLDMRADLLNIFLMTVLVLLLSLALSRLFIYLTDSTQETAILASVPGALSQMLIMAEEEKRADILLVTLTQMSRIILIVLIVPFVSGIFQPASDVNAEPVAVDYISTIFTPEMLLIPIAALALIYILNKIKFPASLMLGPIIVLIIWNLTTGIEFSLDLAFINVAQILFGIRIGLQIASLMTQLNKRLIFSILLQNLILIFGTMFIVFVFQLFTTHQFNDLFLSAAPGGLGQIIVIAIETGGNIAMISSYHIFRIFFIIIVVVPIVGYYLKYLNRKRAK
ncbi:MAG: AbrB family transcriptional regulator [Jeotgalicoccus sp.]|nr:AbrB family transcriptional regulator [Jeotgalicoccus sp.]